MIEHEVCLHHLAIRVKEVFDETLAERGIRATPGTCNRTTAPPLKNVLRPIGLQIFILPLMLSTGRLTVLNSKIRWTFHLNPSLHIPFSPPDPAEVPFENSQGAIHWGISQALLTSVVLRSMRLPISPFTTQMGPSSSQISKDLLTRRVKCVCSMSKHIRMCLFVTSDLMS